MQLRIETLYPGTFYCPGRWPTRDGYMPWKTFWFFARGVAAHDALEQLQMSHAVAAAIGLTFGGDEGQRAASDRLRALRRTAFLEGPR